MAGSYDPKSARQERRETYSRKQSLKNLRPRISKEAVHRTFLLPLLKQEKGTYKFLEALPLLDNSRILDWNTISMERRIGQRHLFSTR
jgi:hypothetical protein